MFLDNHAYAINLIVANKYTNISILNKASVTQNELFKADPVPSSLASWISLGAVV